MCLIVVGEVFYEQVVVMLGQINNMCVLLCGKWFMVQIIIDFVVFYMFLLIYMFKWFSVLELGFGFINMCLIVFNVYDVVMIIVEGGCDLLLCYYYLCQLVQLDVSCYDMLIMGIEILCLYLCCDCNGKFDYVFFGSVKVFVFFFFYISNVYLGCMVELMMVDIKCLLYLMKYYEIDMLESFKMMVLEGYGVVFLLELLVLCEVCNCQLVCIDGFIGEWEVEMEICFYCECLIVQCIGKVLVVWLWEYLVELDVQWQEKVECGECGECFKGVGGKSLCVVEKCDF